MAAAARLPEHEDVEAAAGDRECPVHRIDRACLPEHLTRLGQRGGGLEVELRGIAARAQVCGVEGASVHQVAFPRCRLGVDAGLARAPEEIIPQCAIGGCVHAAKLLPSWAPHVAMAQSLAGALRRSAARRLQPGRRSWNGLPESQAPTAQRIAGTSAQHFAALDNCTMMSSLERLAPAK
jgi:hypothetical protein